MPADTGHFFITSQIADSALFNQFGDDNYLNMRYLKKINYLILLILLHHVKSYFDSDRLKMENAEQRMQL